MTNIMYSGIICQSPQFNACNYVLLRCVPVRDKSHGKGSASCISKEDALYTQQNNRKFLQQYNVGSFVVKLSVVAVMGLLFFGTTLGVHVVGAHAQSSTLR